MSYYRGTAVTEAVVLRLALIRLSNGYRTDVGKDVRVATLRGTPTDVPCTYLLPTTEVGAKQYGVGQRERTYKITCVLNRRDTAISGYTESPTAEWVIVDAIIADVCEALESAGSFSSSLVEQVTYEGASPAYHEEGGELTGVSLTYSIRFAIAKGDPDNSPS